MILGFWVSGWVWREREMGLNWVGGVLGLFGGLRKGERMEEEEEERGWSWDGGEKGIEAISYLFIFIYYWRRRWSCVVECSYPEWRKMMME